ncbi:hypothetical protein PybrP1_006819 [[Pythium] brassicae (nom. inval.)]|nr:hypothetical protein PybrP1_006819 [[Pythium] brassicae (nom. inval.)]
MLVVELFLVLGSAVLCLLSALLVAYLRYHRSEAFKGDESAARKIILPAFEPLLWIIAAVNGLLASAFSTMLVARVDFACLPVGAAESVYAAQQFVILVVLVLLLQKSVCLPSLRRAVILTFLLSTYMIPVACGMLLARLVALALYPYVFARPPDRASKRTLREYAAFAGVYHALLIVTAEVIELRNMPERSSAAWVNEHVLYSLMVEHVDTSTPQQLTVKGTVDYMAPEIIRGHAGLASYGEAADVYALGVTFWDILYPRREKFPRLRSNHLHIFQAVLDGKRPQFERPTPGRSSAAPATVSTALRHVIQIAWHQDAHQRPSAQRIVMLLERIQEHECARFARDFRKDVPSEQTEPQRSDRDGDPAHGKDRDRHHHVGVGLGFNPLAQTTSVTGAFATQRMVELGVVQSSVEAVRLGNMLMDAGVLHHVKHSQPFEDTADEIYFFDQYSIRLYDPVPILEDRSSDPPPKANAVHPDFPTHARGKKSKGLAILDALHLHAPSSSKISTGHWAQHHNHTLFSRIAGLRLHHLQHHWDRRNNESHSEWTGLPTGFSRVAAAS